MFLLSSVIEKPLDPCINYTDCFVSVCCHPKSFSHQTSVTRMACLAQLECSMQQRCVGGCVKGGMHTALALFELHQS